MNIQVSQKIRLLQTVSYYLLYIPLGYVMASLGPSLPVIAEQTNSTLSTIGLLFTTRSIGFLGGAISGGNLFDKFAGNRVVAAMIGIMAFTFTLIPLQANFWVLTIIFIILGFSQGALDVGGNTLLVWTHGIKVAPFINGLHAFFGIGAFVSPFVITAIEMVYGDIQW
ncbi:MAG TPA: MFS transporter, partial [Bacillota bacterium]|nr:MFS transporter [Bacillota bacterium]